MSKGYLFFLTTAIVELFQAFPASLGDNQSYASISHHPQLCIILSTWILTIEAILGLGAFLEAVM